MFSLRYAIAELRRRRGRTVLTVLGLAVGVGLVATVTALSAGLDDAQSEVLEPLTGVGTDMTVTRPLRLEPTGAPADGGPGAGLSDEEREQLQRENGGDRLDFSELGEPGESFSVDRFTSGPQLSFSTAEAKEIGALDGVEAVGRGLTLSLVHIEGEVPSADQGGGRFGGPGGEVAAGGFDVAPISIAGVDLSSPDLALVTPDEITSGEWFSGGAAAAGQAVLSESYALQNDTEVGEKITVAGRSLTVVGIASAPLGGQATDIFMQLAELQRLADREGRINTLRVRATDTAAVDGVAAAVEGSFDDSSVTTASDVADRVEGSLSDARRLSGTLGAALGVVALVAAVGLACLLTLGSVAKRTRELGTLRAIGWPGRTVVRQVAGESLLQGLLGGIAGAVLGVLGAMAISAFGPELTASVAASEPAGLRFGPGPVEQAAQQTTVALDAPVDPGLILLAVGLALLGGLAAGVVGGLRAARLRPADALRHID